MVDVAGRRRPSIMGPSPRSGRRHATQILGSLLLLATLTASCHRGTTNSIDTGVASGRTEGTNWSVDFDSAHNCVYIRTEISKSLKDNCFPHYSMTVSFNKGIIEEHGVTQWWVVGSVSRNVTRVVLTRKDAEPLDVPVFRLGSKHHGFFVIAYPAQPNFVAGADQSIAYDASGREVGRSG